MNSTSTSIALTVILLSSIYYALSRRRYELEKRKNTHSPKV